MSDLATVVSVLANVDKKDLATRVVDLFRKNMSWLNQFEQVAYCYSILEEYEKAIKVMEIALPLSPNPQSSYMYRTNLANLYLKAGKINRALIYIDANEKIQKSKELAYLRLMAEEALAVEQEKNKGVAPTGYWDKNLASKYHQHCDELSAWICAFLNSEKKVYDFGCGWGKYLADLEKAGFKDLEGYEGIVPDNKFFPNIKQQDLSQKFEVKEKGDVICLEVGEHIPAEYMDVFIDNICSASSGKLIMSWAVRGQGGTGHVNCLNNDEVIPLIEKRGFKFLADKTQNARSCIKTSCDWFKKSLFVFERKV
jgi:tetratricopeptide (TPR) repeat protein